MKAAAIRYEIGIGNSSERVSGKPEMPLETEDDAGRRAFKIIAHGAREFMKKKKSKSGNGDALLQAEMLWMGIHGIVSLKIICPAFPFNPTKVLIEKMIETLPDGLK